MDLGSTVKDVFGGRVDVPGCEEIVFVLLEVFSRDLTVGLLNVGDNIQGAAVSETVNVIGNGVEETRGNGLNEEGLEGLDTELVVGVLLLEIFPLVRVILSLDDGVSWAKTGRAGSCMATQAAPARAA